MRHDPEFLDNVDRMIAARHAQLSEVVEAHVKQGREVVVASVPPDHRLVPVGAVWVARDFPHHAKKWSSRRNSWVPA